MGVTVLIFQQNVLEIELSLDSVKKKIVFFFPSEDAIIIKSMQYSKQAHKKKCCLFFLTKSKESPTPIIFFGKCAPLPHNLSHIRVPSFPPAKDPPGSHFHPTPASRSFHPSVLLSVS